MFAMWFTHESVHLNDYKTINDRNLFASGKDAGGAQADWQLFVHDGSGSADSFVLFPSLVPVDGARALHQLDPISAATDFAGHLHAC